MKLSELRRKVAQLAIPPLVNLLTRMGVSPNTLTIVGFLISLAAAWAVATGWLAVGGALVLFAGLFDLVDGAVARARGQTSRFGALLDSTLDRLSEAAVFLGLLFFFARQSLVLPVILGGAALTGSVMVSYVKARAEGLGMQCDVGFLTRPERVIAISLGLLLNGVVVALWLLAILSHFTVAQRLLYLRRQTSRQEG